MKYIFLLSIVMVFFNYKLDAQVSYQQMMDDYQYNFYEVVDAAEKYFSENDKGKGSGYKQYMRWRSLNEGRYAPSGDRHNVDHGISVKAYKKYLQDNPQSYKKSNQSDWEELGPDYSVKWHSASPMKLGGIGRVEDYWVNPTNENQIYLVSKSGGFWKTENGGSTWTNTTDQSLIATGINTMAVNPFNPKEILINTQTNGVAGFVGGTSQGIYRSLDSGNTWQLTSFNPENTGIGGWDNNLSIEVIKYHPNEENLIFIGAGGGVYKSTNNLETYSRVLPINAYFHDIEFHPVDSSIIYAINTADNILFRSFDQGDTFSQSILPPFDITHQIAVSKAAQNNIWHANSDGIWKSNNKGDSFIFLTDPPYELKVFEVSDMDTTHQMLGYVNLLKSLTETNLVFAQGYDLDNYIHADVNVLGNSNGNFYAGTDGYLAKTSDYGETWTRLNETGTGIRENYFIAIAQGNNQFYMTGCQDNGSSVHYDALWTEYTGADGTDCIIHPMNDSWLISNTQGGIKSFTKDRINIIKNTKIGTWFEPFFIDHNNPMRLFAFEGNTISSAESYEMNWQAQGSHQLGNVVSADISYQNSDVMVAASNSTIKLSVNGGKNWSNITPGINIQGISSVRINPKDDNIIIATSQKYNTTVPKIVITYDQGNSWTNISYDLSFMPVMSVEFDYNDEQNIYLGTEIGIYTKPLNAESTWAKHGNGLPNVTVRDMEIHHGSNELFAATWGRGTWKTDLVGRENHPKIVKTFITNPPTDVEPKVGQHQFVMCNIEYDGVLDSVKVLWSEDNASFNNSYLMNYFGGTFWRSSALLPSDCVGTRIFFKVVAYGENGQTSETYKFTYLVKQGDSIVRGDLNNDGFADVIDALFITRYEVGVVSAADDCTNFDPAEFVCLENADFNSDGVVNVIDAMQISQCEVDVPNEHCHNCHK